MKTLLIRGGRVLDPANGIDEIADILSQTEKLQNVERTCQKWQMK